MSNIVSLFRSAVASSQERPIEVDGTLLLFAPMAEIRAAVQEHQNDLEACRLFAQAFRGTARTLVAGMIAPGGQRWARCGLHAHNAGRRAIDLLDFAAELDGSMAPQREGGE